MWVAYRLLVTQEGNGNVSPVASSFWGAMRTIDVANALMGVDNVLGVAGAANGAFDLVIVGLLVSLPIIVFGSSLVLKLVDHFPIITQFDAAVLAFTSARMIGNEPLLDSVIDPAEFVNWLARWLTCAAAVIGVVGAGWRASRRQRSGHAA